MKNLKAAVVIAAYNRPASLKRLLGSVSGAYYPESLDLELVVSLDNSGEDDCLIVAQDFDWSAGKKTIIHHDENLGLKQHILKCGDLSANYDFIILLEDDLYVSKYYIEYALQVHGAYQHDNKIAGYSLYSYYFNETACKQFAPAHNGSDIYFLQLPSSWGQVWTRDQWQRFRLWLKDEYSEEMLKDFLIPENVIGWPDASWKKLFIFYMVINDLYFVYPRISLSTNFMDAGTHHIVVDSYLQVPLQSNAIDYKFIMLNETDFVYDSFCELSPAAIKKEQEALSAFDFEVDLYGTKPVDKISSRYLLTSRSSCNPLFQYSLSLKPQELNILYNVTGNGLVFARKATILDSEYGLANAIRNSYYFNIPKYLLMVTHVNNGKNYRLRITRRVNRVLDILRIIKRKIVDKLRFRR